MNSTRAAVVEGPPGSAAVASGNAATTQAAVAMLRSGGNAMDAAIAAGFASTVAEPGLTSMAGGGFLIVDEPGQDAVVLDFFAAVPGLDRAAPAPEPTVITLTYPSAQQDFRVGPAAAAVPGNLDGFLTAHRRFGRLPLAQVVEPSVLLARHGAEIDASQAYILALIEGIVRHTESASRVYAPTGALLRAGETLQDLELADFLAAVGAGQIPDAAAPGFAAALLQLASEGCPVTATDLGSYAPVWRAPIAASREGWALLTNPAPAFGGQILVEAFASMASETAAEVVSALAAATTKVKTGPAATAGTTHVSVVDAEGLIVAMTTTNGAGGGVLIPGTGVHLNNMLGEDDLLPDGLDSYRPGERLRSMIAPTLLQAPDGTQTALGSGGSARIRTALATVIARVRFGGEPLEDAVTAARSHLADTGTVQAELGVPEPDLLELERRYPVNRWDCTDFYFGGVNAVQRRPDGAVTAVADHRRNGSVAVVGPEESSVDSADRR